VIFPATFREHLYGWHGGNFKNSTTRQTYQRKPITQTEEKKMNQKDLDDYIFFKDCSL
jgi:hypothetical protein